MKPTRDEISTNEYDQRAYPVETSPVRFDQEITSQHGIQIGWRLLKTFWVCRGEACCLPVSDERSTESQPRDAWNQDQ